MSRCQIDDIAVVTHSIHEQNIGAWVHILRPGRDPSEWVVRLMSVARGAVVATGQVEERMPGAEAYCDDCNLQPIRGLRAADPVHSVINEASVEGLPGTYRAAYRASRATRHDCGHVASAGVCALGDAA